MNYADHKNLFDTLFDSKDEAEVENARKQLETILREKHSLPAQALSAYKITAGLDRMAAQEAEFVERISKPLEVKSIPADMGTFKTTAAVVGAVAVGGATLWAVRAFNRKSRQQADVIPPSEKSPSWSERIEGGQRIQSDGLAKGN